jgi:hypothetical protein
MAHAYKTPEINGKTGKEAAAENGGGIPDISWHSGPRPRQHSKLSGIRQTLFRVENNTIRTGTHRIQGRRARKGRAGSSLRA